jgi:tryptophan-rich sensory protein
MKTKHLPSLAVFVALVAAAAFTGAQFEPGAWYEALEKPQWTPPGWLFAPVWTLLYIAIAFAGWLTWRQRATPVTPASILWFLQLLLNASWSWVFFGLREPTFALVNIVILLTIIVAFIVAAESRVAAVLFVPYALWVGFATALNLQIVRLN